jgi:uncharacterized protein (DUF305 family)
VRSIAAACVVSALAACAIGAVACGRQGRTGASTPTRSATAPPADGVALAASKESVATPPPTEDDVASVTGIIDHHLMAVLLGESCLEKAVHDELRSLCESLVAVEGDQVQALQSRQEQYRVVHEPEMAPGIKQRMARLSALSGAGFEVELLRAMARHHREGVREARGCVERARDPELIRLCRDIGSTERAALANAQSWLCSWYRRC